MHPVEKFHFYVVTATLILMFAGLRVGLAQVPHDQPTTAIAGVVVTAFGSWGLYRTLAAACMFLMHKWDWLLKQVLGPEFLKGTWVGFVRTKTGAPRLIVEKYEQSLYSLVVRGWSFLPDREQ